MSMMGTETLLHFQTEPAKVDYSRSPPQSSPNINQAKKIPQQSVTMASAWFLKIHPSMCSFKLLLNAFAGLFQSAFGLLRSLLGAYCFAKIIVKLPF